MNKKLWIVFLILGLFLCITSILIPNFLEFTSLIVGLFLLLLGISFK